MKTSEQPQANLPRTTFVTSKTLPQRLLCKEHDIPEYLEQMTNR